MKIERLTFAPYELPFRHPLHTARGTVTVRRGYIVAVHTDSSVGIGDVAPLPEFGTETFAEAGEELRRITSIPTFPHEVEEGAQRGAGSERCPATRFGVEAAIRTAGNSKSQIPNPKPHTLAVNALIGGWTPEETLQAARRAVEAGYRTLKIKVGMREVRSDIEVMRMLRSAFPDVALRADANGAWPFDEARQFAHGVTACHLEYVEDPLFEPDTESLHLFRLNCAVPLACDEVAESMAEIEELIARRLCDVLILKPSRIGSYSDLERLSRMAKDAGIGVVITSLLESSVGLCHVAQCAAVWGTAELAQGLSTAELFEQDTLTQPLVPENGELRLLDPAELTKLLTDGLRSKLDIEGS